MYLIINGRIVTEDTILTGYELLIEGNRIAKIIPQDSLDIDTINNAQVIDAAGGYVTPGFIDIHSDYIEHMAAPRPNCLMDFNMSIRETEKELVLHGITTMFHSLSLFKSTEFKHKPIRDPENVSKFMDLIEKSSPASHLIRHRFHARFEIDNYKEVDNLKSYIAAQKVQMVSFMDHTPGQGQYSDIKVYKEIVKGYNDQFDDEEIDRIIAKHQSKPKLTMEGIKEISDMALHQGIAIASHDDDSEEKLELVKGFGATISEFPITLETARKAKEMGLFTMAGAPNILLGGSHSGNLSAAEAIRENCIDILCSDYYPPALLHAVFEMARKYQMSLVEMFKLVTTNPAKAVKMDEEIGSVRVGKKADLLVIQTLKDDFPVISAVFVDGRLVQQTNYNISSQNSELSSQNIGA